MISFFDDEFQEKEYKYRVAFLVSSHHFMSTGGIGAFSRSFHRMCEELDILVDYILDKKPKDNLMIEYAKENNINIIYPDDISYLNHSKIYSFAESLNIERILNFRNSFMIAAEKFVYDSIILNTPEAHFAIYPLGLYIRIPVIFYTHHENFVFIGNSKVFSESYNEMMINSMNLSGLTIGTQSEMNVERLKENIRNENVFFLPMKIPENNLLKNYDIKKSGVIFIGRHEDRKNPSEFIRMIKSTGLPAKVLTNNKGKNKFIEDFKNNGIINYEIKSNIFGEEKVQFIKSAKIGYHPSKLESYGFSAFESLHSCPTVLLEEYKWHGAFDDVIVCSKNKVDETILKLYNDESYNHDEILEKMVRYDKTINNIWFQHLISKKEFKRNDKKTLLFEFTKDKISFKHLLKKLNRPNVSVEDIISIYNKNHMLNITHTKSDTFLHTK